VRSWRAILAAGVASAALVAPGQAAAAAELTLGPQCIKSSSAVVHADLWGLFNPFSSPEDGFFMEVRDPAGNYVAATHSDLTLDSNPNTGTGGYHFNIHLPAGLPAGNYRVIAYGSRPPPEGDDAILKISPACDSILMGNVDFFDPVDGVSNVGGDAKQVSAFVTYRSVTVRKLGVYLDGHASNNGISQRVRGVIYSHAQARPASLVGRTFEFKVPVGMGPQWVELYMAPPVQLAPGLYWLGIQSAPAQSTVFGTPPVARYGWTTKASSRRYNSDAYADGPSPVFGDSALDGQQLAIYASGS
jgi:hypothetical protein